MKVDFKKIPIPKNLLLKWLVRKTAPSVEDSSPLQNRALFQVLSNPHASLQVEPVTHLTDELGPREEYGNSGELFLLFFISTTLQADFPG